MPMEARREKHYWEEADPATALAMLEDEMAQLALPGDSASPTDEQCRSCQGMSRLRRLLEDECAAQVCPRTSDRLRAIEFSPAFSSFSFQGATGVLCFWCVAERVLERNAVWMCECVRVCVCGGGGLEEC